MMHFLNRIISMMSTNNTTPTTNPPVTIIQAGSMPNNRKVTALKPEALNISAVAYSIFQGIATMFFIPFRVTFASLSAPAPAATHHNQKDTTDGSNTQKQPLMSEEEKARKKVEEEKLITQIDALDIFDFDLDCENEDPLEAAKKRARDKAEQRFLARLEALKFEDIDSDDSDFDDDSDSKLKTASTGQGFHLIN